MKKCGAKTKAGKKCQHPAGHGTDHVGSGKCRIHGGTSKGASKGNKFAQKHGIYSRLFSDDEMSAAKEMQGSIENELAIARLQLMKLLQEQQKAGINPVLDKVEEKTIVQDDESQKKERMQDKFLKNLVKSAEKAGEYYDPDGDEDYIFDDGVKNGQESEVFERKRTFQRRNFHDEFIRLTSLIARLEQQILQSKKTKAEIKVIEVTGNKTDDDDDKRTDTELDQEIQELIGGFKI